MKLIVAIVVLVASFTLAASFDNIKPVEDFLPQGFLEQELRKGRIIGGQTATPGQFPYQAGLRMNKSSSGGWCGGVLVSEKYVLTAAHCAINADFIDVSLGAQNIRNEDETGRLNIRVFSNDITVHKAYNARQIANDIAILRLPYAVNVTNTIKPVSLPTYAEGWANYDGSTLIISGWGRNSNTAPSITDELQFTSVYGQKQSICNYYFSSARDSNICTETVYGRGTCNGDSGGPLVATRSNGDRVLLGLTSFGSSRGCVACWPSVFVRVSYYLDWIAANSDIKVSAE